MSDQQGQPVEWVMGKNDQPGVGDCVLVACANMRLKRTGVRMMDGEVLEAYSKIAGWRPMEPETNSGVRVEAVLDYWRDQGWPSDPLDKIAGWDALAIDEIRAAVERDGAIVAWAELPVVDDDYSFDDRALGTDGVAAHAFAVIAADDDGITVVTWAREVDMSWAWVAQFMRGAYAVRFPE